MNDRKVERLSNGNVTVTIPWKIKRISGRMQIIFPDGNTSHEDNSLITKIARGRRWQKFIDEGKFSNAEDLALAVGRERSVVATTLRLAMLAPQIIEKIASGDYPEHWTADYLRKPMPEIWAEQVAYLNM